MSSNIVSYCIGIVFNSHESMVSFRDDNNMTIIDSDNNDNDR